MRIGIEAFRIFRKHKHGIDIAALELIRHLQIADTVNEYFVFAFADVDDSLIKDTDNFKIIKLPRVWLPLAEQFMLPYYASKYKLDMLHCTGNTAPFFFNRKLIITLHDIIYLEKLNLFSGTVYQRLGNLYRRLIVPLVIKKADRIITVSHHERKNILKLMPQVKSKITVIHNACSDHFKPLAQEQLKKEKAQIGLPDKYVLYHGNTDPKKNVLNVLKAFAVLKEKKQLLFKLVITDISNEVLDRELKKNGMKSLRSFIHTVGYIDNKKLPVFYNLAFAFLYPSKRESFGIPILEAMQCGTPVITSFYSSMPEIAGEAALKVDPQQPEQIAGAIYQLYNCQECHQRRVESGFEQSKQFSWKVSAHKVAAIYHQALAD